MFNKIFTRFRLFRKKVFSHFSYNPLIVFGQTYVIILHKGNSEKNGRGKMKTFKLISLHVVEDDGLINIKLLEGLVINQENDSRTWLLEAYVSSTYLDYFKKLSKKGSPFTLQIIISRRENDPAYFYMESLQINQLSEDKMSLLFSGKVKNANSTYAELLLAHLIEKGFTGKKLLNEFKVKMLTKPSISPVQK
jgi:YwpF-like protein